ncbi:SDR family NAD(P)-dependent oxidoreductase [Brevundimonas faecalis]|uniref:NAD(P)-dependent dehydrogenase (Short-subunit alcohol dehydrogenase family) n=1 Tax=Brevundimonas faecalis TaxID=947378 RepID=A0ABV2R9W1_9CAUL
MSQRVTVITGASGVLGRAVADAALARGDLVAAIDFGAVERPDDAAWIGLGGVDLTDPAAAQAAMDAVAERFGRIDGLLNIAGGFVWQMTEGPLDGWNRMHRMNLETALNACRAALPHLSRVSQGRIVNVGAWGAVQARAGMGAYAASKASVHRLTESLAEETKGTGLTVNAVLPSIIDTPANRADMPDADAATWVRPAELAAVMLFLASDAASAVTGALVPVRGRV